MSNQNKKLHKEIKIIKKNLTKKSKSYKLVYKQSKLFVKKMQNNQKLHLKKIEIIKDSTGKIEQLKNLESFNQIFKSLSAVMDVIASFQNRQSFEKNRQSAQNTKLSIGCKVSRYQLKQSSIE